MNNYVTDTQVINDMKENNARNRVRECLGVGGFIFKRISREGFVGKLSEQSAKEVKKPCGCLGRGFQQWEMHDWWCGSQLGGLCPSGNMQQCWEKFLAFNFGVGGAAVIQRVAARHDTKHPAVHRTAALTKSHLVWAIQPQMSAVLRLRSPDLLQGGCSEPGGVLQDMWSETADPGGPITSYRGFQLFPERECEPGVTSFFFFFF